MEIEQILSDKNEELRNKDDHIFKLNAKIQKMTKEMYQLKRKYRNSLCSTSESVESNVVPVETSEYIKVKEAGIKLYESNLKLQQENALFKNCFNALDSAFYPDEMDRSNIHDQLLRVETAILNNKAAHEYLQSEFQSKLQREKSFKVDIEPIIKKHVGPFIEKCGKLEESMKSVQLENQTLTAEIKSLKRQLKIHQNTLESLEKSISEQEVTEVDKILKQESKFAILTKYSQELRQQLDNISQSVECNHKIEKLDQLYLCELYESISQLKQDLYDSKVKYSELKSYIDLNNSMYRKYHLDEPKESIYAHVGSPAIMYFVAKQNDLKLLVNSHNALLKHTLHLKTESIPKSSYLALENDLQNLKIELSNVQKMNTRIKEAFAKKAAQVNQVSASVLGWQIDLLEHDRIKVFDSNGLYFIFSGSMDKLMLVGMDNDQYEQLKPLVEEWITRKKSFSGFLATVLLLSK